MADQSFASNGYQIGKLISLIETSACRDPKTGLEIPPLTFEYRPFSMNDIVIGRNTFLHPASLSQTHMFFTVLVGFENQSQFANLLPDSQQEVMDQWRMHYCGFMLTNGIDRTEVNFDSVSPIMIDNIRHRIPNLRSKLGLLMAFRRTSKCNFSPPQ